MGNSNKIFASFIDKKLSLVKQCDFCLIPKIKTTEYFRSMYGDLPHTLDIPGVPTTFTVLQDLVPIAEQGGHLLLIPNIHSISLAAIRDKKGLSIARDVVLHSLRKYFPNNPIFIFEHGPGFLDGESIACGGCHLDHAHGHLLVLPKWSQLTPIKNRMEEVLSTYGWGIKNLNAIYSDEIFTNIAKNTGINPYLHIGMVMPDSTRISLTYVQTIKSLNIPSQLLRI